MGRYVREATKDILKQIDSSLMALAPTVSDVE